MIIKELSYKRKLKERMKCGGTKDEDFGQVDPKFLFKKKIKKVGQRQRVLTCFLIFNGFCPYEKESNL